MADDAGYNSVVKPFLNQYCVRCHGAQKPEGDFRVDTLAADFSALRTSAQWAEIMQRISSGEMPPEGEPQPSPERTATVIEWITSELLEGEAARQAASGPVSFHRLNRREYANTIRDLLGVTFDVDDPTGLPEDSEWQGFERIGTALTVSPMHIEKYLQAADLVLNEALSLGPRPERSVVYWGPFELRRHKWPKSLQKQYEEMGIADKVRVDIHPNGSATALAGAGEIFHVPVSGYYRVRVKVSGIYPPGKRPPRLQVYASGIDRLLYESDIDASQDQPVTKEFETHLPAGPQTIRILNAIPGIHPQSFHARSHITRAFTGFDKRFPWQIKLTNDDYEPLVPILLMDSVEWEGPLVDEWPTKAHNEIFFRGETAEKNADYAREIVERFAGRAFRRPIREGELDRLMPVYEYALQSKDGFEYAVKEMLVAVLCSRSFLYLEEGQLGSTSHQLNDWEIAARLSYFLWSTMPDRELFDLAEAGQLKNPQVRREQVRRMLRDPRSDAFVETFPREWLQLRQVGMFPPDSKLYPQYDDFLETSMRREPIEFFREVLRKNLSVREFIDSDWAVINHRLADHYQIAGVNSEGFQKISLPVGNPRGGLLTQAAILSMTSDGTRHRPIHRGKWVMESILNQPPAPPPGNVGDLDPPEPTQKKMTLREQLESHRNDVRCASCHRKLDPLGFAFENFDAIGRWRTVEDVKEGVGDNPTIQAHGKLPDGRQFEDADGLKVLLAADMEPIANAFAQKLASYALRRGTTFTERRQLSRIVSDCRAYDYQLATLIESLVANDLFLTR